MSALKCKSCGQEVGANGEHDCPDPYTIRLPATHEHRTAAPVAPLEIVSAVMRERAYQDGKWGPIDEHGHSVGEWLLIMESELREAKEAWCSNRGDAGALEELLQVVSVGFACMEQHGVVERGN